MTNASPTLTDENTMECRSPVCAGNVTPHRQVESGLLRTRRAWKCLVCGAVDSERLHPGAASADPAGNQSSGKRPTGRSENRDG